jgi:cell division protein FtsN
MEPFEVICPACQKSLRVKQPELVGKRVSCPQCKEKFTIERPAPVDDAPAPDMPPVVADSPAPSFSDGPSFGGPSITATSSPTRTKKSEKNQQMIIFGGVGASLVLLVIIYIVNSQMQAAEQARLRSRLSATDRKALEKLEAEGKTVRLEDKNPLPPYRPAADPVPKKPTKEMPRVDEAELLHGHLQDLKRAHKQSDTITALAAELGRLSSQYRREDITPEDFLAKVTELATKVEETERVLVKKALSNAVSLERPDLDADVLARFVEAYDKAVLETRAKDWKLSDDARKLVHDAVKKTHGEHKLGGNKSEMEDLLVKFSEEYY